MTIRNIFCVGRNYVQHVEELKNEVPTAPLWFMKPTHSACLTKENPMVALPKNLGNLHYEVELVVYLKKDFKAGAPLEEFIGDVGLGIDFTLRDLQSQLKAKGLPWLKAKGFKNAAVLSETQPFVNFETFKNYQFQLKKNQISVQTGSPETMIFPLQTLLADCHENFGLKAGDILFTGTPAGVGIAQTGDQFEMLLNGQSLGQFEMQ